MWTRPDGSARIDQARGPALDIDGQLVSTTLPEPEALLSTDLLPAGTFDAALPETLPREPEALLDILLTRVGVSIDSTPRQWGWFLADEIASLHGSFDIPRDLAAVMWEALAAAPGVHDLGETTARDGQPAHGFAVRWEPPGSTSSEVLVLHASTTTGQLVGTERITLFDVALGISEPTLTEFEVWLRQGRVQELGEPHNHP